MDWGLHAFKKRMVEIFALESVRFGFKYELRFVLVVWPWRRGLKSQDLSYGTYKTEWYYLPIWGYENLKDYVKKLDKSLD